MANTNDKQGKGESVVATPRTGTFNKNHARRVRVSGLIPAVVYGGGGESVAVTVDPKAINRILHSDSGHNTVFDLSVEGAGAAKGMIVDWQHEPIKGALLHIDIKRIAMDKAMQVSVPVNLEGTPVGVKNQGGVLSQVLHEVEVECLPGNIPSHIDVDVSGLELNGSILVKDLPQIDNVKYLGEEDATVANVQLPKEDEALTAGEPTPSEPEVAKKGKQDEEAK